MPVKRGHYSKGTLKGKSRSYTRQSPRKAPQSFKSAGARVHNGGSRLNRSPRAR